MPFLRARDEAALVRAKRNLDRFRSLTLIVLIVAWLALTAYAWQPPGSGNGFTAFLRPFAFIVVSGVGLGAALLIHIVTVAVAGLLVRGRWPVWAAGPVGLAAGVAFTIAFGWAVWAVMNG